MIAIGGGKVLDAGKLLAHRQELVCITVPTSAATCAGWTALANVYTPAGAFLGDVALARCPDLLIFDHALVRQAPPRTLVFKGIDCSWMVVPLHHQGHNCFGHSGSPGMGSVASLLTPSAFDIF